MSPAETVDMAGKIASSQFAGFIVLLLVVLVMGLAFSALWGFVKQQIGDMRVSLEKCQTAHEECQNNNRMLAQAVVAQADGKKWEAKTRAELVLSPAPTPTDLPMQGPHL